MFTIIKRNETSNVQSKDNCTKSNIPQIIVQKRRSKWTDVSLKQNKQLEQLF